jgi:gamma-glutamyl-gamma-aminobutyrate hydrolase PuuD
LKSVATHKDDNTIEGFIHVKYPIIGVMWHPERNPDNNSIQLFKEIFLVKK